MRMRDVVLSGLMIAALIRSPDALAAGLSVPGGTTDPAQVTAGTYRLDSHHGRIAWSIDHLGFSTYVGLVPDVNATLVLNPENLSETKLDVVVNMSSMGTLYPAMDQRLRSPEYFDVAKYPTANFVSSRIQRTGNATADVYGTLSMHGITKPVILHVVFNQAGQNPLQKIYEAGFQATATINRFDFGVNTDPEFIGSEISLQMEGEFHLAR
jgi:polyisoprenoid-binding protein YceI